MSLDDLKFNSEIHFTKLIFRFLKNTFPNINITLTEKPDDSEIIIEKIGSSFLEVSKISIKIKDDWWLGPYKANLNNIRPLLMRRKIILECGNSPAIYPEIYIYGLETDRNIIGPKTRINEVYMIYPKLIELLHSIRYFLKE